MSKPIHQKRLMIAAPSSGSGKTVLTLGILRALRDKNVDVVSAKAGPDFIDPGFHEVASGKPSVNLDPWAMSSERLMDLAGSQGEGLLIVEAIMGLIEGAADGTGSAADLATVLGIPVILVVDVAKQSHSIAALVEGFSNHRADINVAGAILNKVGSPRHEALLRSALEKIGIPIVGAIYRDEALAMPERHLGLMQAGEYNDIEKFIDGVAANVADRIDLDAFMRLASDSEQIRVAAKGLLPLGQRIAIAKDEAFSFAYPHLLADWRRAGAELSFFSPLNNEAPDGQADAVYLPGGYPELHAARLADAMAFKAGMREVAANGVQIYGECGGYMVLGDSVVDKNGVAHRMLELLSLETSFAKRKLHLGYRNLTTVGDFCLGNRFAAHEFHYTSALREEGEPLFEAQDALGEPLGSVGLRNANVMGSYMHLIDQRSTS